MLLCRKASAESCLEGAESRAPLRVFDTAHRPRTSRKERRRNVGVLARTSSFYDQREAQCLHKKRRTHFADLSSVTALRSARTDSKLCGVEVSPVGRVLTKKRESAQANSTSLVCTVCSDRSGEGMSPRTIAGSHFARSEAQPAASPRTPRPSKVASVLPHTRRERPKAEAGGGGLSGGFSTRYRKQAHLQREYGRSSILSTIPPTQPALATKLQAQELHTAGAKAPPRWLPERKGPSSAGVRDSSNALVSS